MEVSLSRNQQRFHDYQQQNQEIVHGPGPRRGERLRVIKDEEGQDVGVEDPYPNVTELRKNYKRIFQKNCDQKWFKNNVTCIHWIKYLTHHDSSKGTYKNKLRRLLFGTPQVRPGMVSRNEFSTLGYIEEQNYAPGAFVGIKIKKKHVSFAAVVDSWTEFNWGTPQAIRDFYENSGLPKRPYQSISAYGVIFDEEDFRNSPVSHMKEVIVDNFTWDTIVVNEDWARDDLEIQEMIDYIENDWNKSFPQHIINIEYF